MLLRATQRALRSGARRKSTVVMMRHGESTWNLENKFTGMKRGAEGRRPSSSSPSTSDRSTQAGTTALYLRKVMKKQRKPEG